MNLDELQSVQSRERQTDTLQHLRESFYEDAGAYIHQLRDERDASAERASDPFDSPDVNRLSDDIVTAEQTVEALYERRVGKVVKMASLVAADMPAEQDGLTREERDLFETLVGTIEENREHVLDVLTGESSPGAVASGTSDGEARPAETTGVDAAAAMGPRGTSVSETVDEIPPERQPEQSKEGGSPEAGDSEVAGDSGASGDPTSEGRTAVTGTVERDVDRRTVRITDDVGSILGVDEREYDLSTDDVVTLPTANVEPLVARDAAEPLE